MPTKSAAEAPIHYLAFRTHKKGEDLPSCQDAWCANAQAGRYAISDGATQSFFAGEWAELLVNRFCEDSEDSRSLLAKEDWKTWLEPIQDHWLEIIKKKVQQNPVYYVTNRLTLREPAAATFVGLELNSQSSTETRWKAMIVGDSCLFHLSGDTLTSYLLTDPGQFTSRPECFASYSKNNEYEPKFLSGSVGKDDFLFLATDALAKWILHQYQSGSQCWRSLLELGTDKEFQAFVEEQRETGPARLENDDTTLVVISLTPRETKAKLRTTVSLPQPADNDAKPDLSSFVRVRDQLLLRTKALERSNANTRIMAIAAVALALAAILISIFPRDATRPDSSDGTKKPATEAQIRGKTGPTTAAPLASAGSVRLPAGTKILDKHNKAIFTLSIESEGWEVVASETANTVPTGLEIELRPWVAASLAQEHRGDVTIGSSARVRTEPGTSAPLLGYFDHRVSPREFPKRGERTADEIQWVQFSIVGRPFRGGREVQVK